MEKLEIRKNGHLVRTRWVYEQKKNKGKYIERDVTEKATLLLFEECVLAKGVTLRDIFRLVKKDLKIFSVILGKEAALYIKEGLEKKGTRRNKGRIKELELYWSVSLSRTEKQERLEGSSCPYFHGLGFELKKGQDGFKPGEKIPYSLSFVSVQELIDLPLRLRFDSSLWSIDYDSEDINDKKLLDIENHPMTFGQILFGIFSELAFYGTPKERDKKAEEISKLVKTPKKK